MIDFVLFSLPTWAVIALIVGWCLLIVGGVVFCSIGQVSDRQIERMERRMAELCRKDVAERRDLSGQE